MSSYKQQIDSVIEKYGSNVTHRVKTYPGTYDAFGEPDVSTTTDTTIKAVKDSNLISNLSLTSAGRLSDSSALLIIKADVTVDERTSQFVFGGQTYNVMQVQSLELSGEVLAQLVEIGLTR